MYERGSNLELAVDCVIFEEVAERSDIDEGVVDGCDLDVGVVQRCSQNEPSNTPKAIDA